MEDEMTEGECELCCEVKLLGYGQFDELCEECFEALESAAADCREERRAERRAMLAD